MTEKYKTEWKPTTEEEARAVIRELIDCLRDRKAESPDLRARCKVAIQFLRQLYREERAKRREERAKQKEAREKKRRKSQTVRFENGFKIVTTEYANERVTRLTPQRKGMPGKSPRKLTAVTSKEGQS